MGSPQRTAGRPRPGQGVARRSPRPAGRRADRPLIFDAITVVVSFVVALVLYPPTIRLLTRVRAGQVIQEELPDSHQKKAGTPTGGGTLFVALAMIAGVLAIVAGHGGALQAIAGLAAVVLLLPSARSGEKAVALTLCGGLAAFLIFNRHPARVFMGDTGALAIGFALAALAIQQGFMLLLPIVGLVFVLETLSVIIQVAYFKASGGRRVFTMTPIHYTFQHEGWSENRIALSFWGAGLVSAIAAVALVRLLV